MKLYFDGGCRPNPGGVIELAVVAAGQTWHRIDHRAGDNSDGEWLAAIEALRVASGLGLRDVILLGDSAMVVRQITGAGRLAGRFAAYRAEFARLAEDFERVRLRHVGRKQNLAGIALERLHGRI